MPGIGTVKIIVDADTLATMIRQRCDITSDVKYRTFISDLLEFMDQRIPDDAELLEITNIERDPGKFVMVWTHPSFPSEPLVKEYNVVEPKIPESWDYIK